LPFAVPGSPPIQFFLLRASLSFGFRGTFSGLCVFGNDCSQHGVEGPPPMTPCVLRSRGSYMQVFFQTPVTFFFVLSKPPGLFSSALSLPPYFILAGIPWPLNTATPPSTASFFSLLPCDCLLFFLSLHFPPRVSKPPEPLSGLAQPPSFNVGSHCKVWPPVRSAVPKNPLARSRTLNYRTFPRGRQLLDRHLSLVDAPAFPYSVVHPTCSFPPPSIPARLLS